MFDSLRLFEAVWGGWFSVPQPKWEAFGGPTDTVLLFGVGRRGAGHLAHLLDDVFFGFRGFA